MESTEQVIAGIKLEAIEKWDAEPVLENILGISSEGSVKCLQHVKNDFTMGLKSCGSSGNRLRKLSALFYVSQNGGPHGMDSVSVIHDVKTISAGSAQGRLNDEDLQNCPNTSNGL